MILRVWTSVSASNSSSSVPKPPGKMTKPLEILDEHRLPDEEVAEVDREVGVAVLRLLEGEFDVAADRQPAGLVGPAVGGLHQAGAAAGDDGEAGLGQGPAHLPGRLVHRVVLAEPGRAEDRDRGADLGQGVDPVDELPLNPEDPPGVGVGEGGHLRRSGPRR